MDFLIGLLIGYWAGADSKPSPPLDPNVEMALCVLLVVGVVVASVVMLRGLKRGL
ncbi:MULTISPECIES: hypothetical protein [unclassified Cupriavidus]|uniref:hypothetical protein n=1 Tax=unclassified Cupriavidus TaxID=2640874 RepID=UPI001BFFF811|nr:MULTISPECIES: hypothetical protein [unclassified Cupriavidus]MCA3185575.1 hypothetical protein [Cupriavidus sp.]MCA3189216.1 hypothetical protein [Cupriavidus sp.]MCA3195296.1 hypothetical protein [Cupriavidus sp.]MCA3200851.1 hypothetical protein [Cupriavidus sp.]MCA3230951.1 hypothetical protein [Cupriavidus sp.]